MMSLKIDDRSLADGTYRSGHDRQSYQPPPYQPSPHQPLPHHQSPKYHLQRPQFSEFFNENESPIYPSNDLEDDYRRRRKFANSNPNRRGGYPITIGEAGFLIISMI